MSSEPHIADAESAFIVYNVTPDFCRVGKYIIPFDITRPLSKEEGAYSGSVFARGEKILLVDSVIDGVNGDSGDGVGSGTSQNRGHCKVLVGSTSVLIEGRMTARHGDLVDMNGSVVVSQSAGSGESKEAEEVRNARYDEQIQFVMPDGEPIGEHVKYRLRLADGSEVAGSTDSNGKTARVSTEGPLAITDATLFPRVERACCAKHAAASDEGTSTVAVPVSDVQTNSAALGTSVRVVETPVDQARFLTSGEVAMAGLIFKDSIAYEKVTVYKGSFFPFNLQSERTAVTPYNRMYFLPPDFQEDFSVADTADQHWFMHEMVHVWQHQMGYPVMLRGAVRMGLTYEYGLVPGRSFRDFNMEAQGEVIADYFVVKHRNSAQGMRMPGYAADIDLFEEVLSEFLSDPANARSLPR